MFLSLIFFLILCAASANFIGAFLPVLVRRAVRRGFIDLPEGRKNHDRPVPPVGGLVIIPFFLLLLPVFGISPLVHWPLFLSLLIILVIGFLDDYFDISASVKLGTQVFVALIMTLGGEAVLLHLGHLFGVDHQVDLLWLSVPFSVVCFVFLINAMNMIDGVDGLAGGISFVMLGWMALAAFMGGDIYHGQIAIFLMSLLFGFLLHNMRYPGHKRATVFLGDSGSMSLGLIISWLGMNVAMDEGSVMSPIAVALVIAVPIIDAFALFIVRKRSGRRAFEPGRDHLHHQLLSQGFSPGFVAVFVILITFVLGGVGVLGSFVEWGEGYLTFFWLFLLLGYTFFMLKRACVLYTDIKEISV